MSQFSLKTYLQVLLFSQVLAALLGVVNLVVERFEVVVVRVLFDDREQQVLGVVVIYELVLLKGLLVSVVLESVLLVWTLGVPKVLLKPTSVILGDRLVSMRLERSALLPTVFIPGLRCLFVGLITILVPILLAIAMALMVLTSGLKIGLVRHMVAVLIAVRPTGVVLRRSLILR